MGLFWPDSVPPNQLLSTKVRRNNNPMGLVGGVPRVRIAALRFQSGLMRNIEQNINRKIPAFNEKGRHFNGL
jgi:hypothetical protein